MKLLLLMFAVVPMLGLVQGSSLDGLKDRNRVLLVFTPSADDGRYRQQRQWFEEQAAAMKERDLVLVVGQEAERKRFKVAAAEFTVILVGKDGGEKMRAHQPVTAGELERTIDAMPMRRDEMRR